MSRLAENKELTCEDGSTIQFLEKNKNFYMHKTTLIFGPAGSGKSTILDEILYLCRDDIPNILVISPTNVSNRAFTDKVPDICIKPTITKDKLAEVLQRQKNLAEVYQKANDMNILSKLFEYCNDFHSKSYLRQVENETKMIKDEINRKTAELAKRKTLTNAVEQNYQNEVRKLYKRIINKNMDILGQFDLTPDEKCALKYIDLNPDLMLVFEDCASLFSQFFKNTKKDENNVFKEMIYNIRWLHLSLIITSQDDKLIPSEFRKNSMISFFTSHQTALANFQRSANNYSKQERAEAEKIITRVFRQDCVVQNYQKLVYIRGVNVPFRYTIADLHAEFRFGSNAIWILDEENKKQKKDTIEDNPFYKVAQT